MRPTTLRPGNAVHRIDGTGVTLFFVERDPAMRRCWFRAPEYVGLNGPDDDGLCFVSDYDLSRKFERGRAKTTIVRCGEPGNVR